MIVAEKFIGLWMKNSFLNDRNDVYQISANDTETFRIVKVTRNDMSGYLTKIKEWVLAEAPSPL